MKKKSGTHPLSIQELCSQSCQLVCTDAIMTVNRQGILSSFNRGASVMFGYHAAEVVGKPLASLLLAGDSAVQALWERLKQNDLVHIFETEILASDHRNIPVQLSASLLKDRAGRNAGFVAICHDLSALRTLESEIQQKDQFFGAILKNSGDAILTLDPDGRITSWNKGAEDIFGYSEEEMLGQSLDVVLPIQLKEQRELEKIAELTRTQGHLRSYQTQRLTKDGRLIDVVFTRAAICDAQGNLVGYSSIVRDITDEKLIARHMIQMEKLSAIGELAAGLAHEIKNPLAGIKGAIEIIRDGMPSDHPHRGVLGEVLSEVARIDRTVIDLLSYSKPRSPDFQRVALPVLAQNAIAFVQKMADSKQIRLSLETEPEVPPLMGDENALKQLFLNLLLNAIEAVPKEGAIQIQIKTLGETAIQIEVIDNGPGIPLEKQSRIFAPFYTTKKTGTGLGLATCRRIATDHGGEIHVESREGKGANFVISLPLNRIVPRSLAAL
jgi:two-component system, sporulation sensor kinase A